MATVRTVYLPSGRLLTVVDKGGGQYQAEERDNETGALPRVVKTGSREQVNRYVQARILKAKRG